MDEKNSEYSNYDERGSTIFAYTPTIEDRAKISQIKTPIGEKFKQLLIEEDRYVETPYQTGDDK